MAGFGDYMKGALDGVRAIFETSKEAYEEASRYARLRLWFLVVFFVDVAAVVIFVASSGGRPLDLVVWFDPGFPSNMIVFRNEGAEPLVDVRLELDGQYRLQVERLPLGLRGFEINRDFRDGSNQPPPDAYRPKVVRVTTADDEARIPVESRTDP